MTNVKLAELIMEKDFKRQSFDNIFDLIGKARDNMYSTTIRGALIEAERTHTKTKERINLLELSLRETKDCIHYKMVLSDPATLNNDSYNNCLFNCEEMDLTKHCEDYEIQKMNEKQIKELISVKYPNPKPFWENNKDWILELVKEVQVNQRKWDLGQTITILEEDEYSNEIKIHRIHNELEELNNGQCVWSVWKHKHNFGNILELSNRSVSIKSNLQE